MSSSSVSAEPVTHFTLQTKVLLRLREIFCFICLIIAFPPEGPFTTDVTCVLHFQDLSFSSLSVIFVLSFQISLSLDLPTLILFSTVFL